MNLPAHQTKHLAELPYTLPDGTAVVLKQDCETPDSTGRTVWLGAQVLAVYLSDFLGRNVQRKKVIELGSGTGLLALSLFSQGYDVLATDLPLIVDGVLKENLEGNSEAVGGGRYGDPRLESKVLDWSEEPDKWSWDESANPEKALKPPFDVIVTADTVYEPALSQPLLRSLHGLASLSPAASIYVALEARDPQLVADFLASASSDWSFKTSRVDHGRLKRLVESKESTLDWEDETDWEGIEVWKCKLTRVRLKGKAKG
ncbi:hypothetical protein JCM8547_004430 [Rhodosporidiobolus lusitaniae]